jgi:hypothetical protein
MPATAPAQKGRQCTTIYYLQMALSSLCPIFRRKGTENGARPKNNFCSVVVHAAVDQELPRSCWRSCSWASIWRLSFSSCRSCCSPVVHGRRRGGPGKESRRCSSSCGRDWLSEVPGGGLGEGCCERRCSKALARAYGLGGRGSGCRCVARWRWLGGRPGA